MAKQEEIMRFGKYKGAKVENVPTTYLLWVYGAFTKYRNRIRGVLYDRGFTQDAIDKATRHVKVLGKVPVSFKKQGQSFLKPRKQKLSDEQRTANAVARVMGHTTPYPKTKTAPMHRYFEERGIL